MSIDYLDKKVKDLELADLETIDPSGKDEATVADLIDDVVASTLADPQWREDAAEKVDQWVAAGPLESYDKAITRQILQGAAVLLPDSLKSA